MEYLKIAIGLLLPFLFCLFLLVKVFNTEDDKEATIFISEKRLNGYLDSIYNRRISLVQFQSVRVITSAVLFLLMILLKTSTLLAILIALFMYFFFYFYVKLEYKKKIKMLNRLMPYYMKKIVYFCFNNPVNNALIKSLDYADELYLQDMKQMIEDIDKDPTSFKPYEDFEKKYDMKIKNLDFYFKSLYSLSNSRTKDSINVLNSLNQTISDDLNIVRKEKNSIVNDIIGYVGFIPVVAMVVVMTIILFITISYI